MLQAPYSAVTALPTLIRFGLFALLGVFCIQKFKPFMDPLLWSVILAIAMYPLLARLRCKVFDADDRAGTPNIVVMNAVVMVPTYLLGLALIESVEYRVAMARSRKFTTTPPPESVSAWPVAGQRIYDAWQMADTDASGLIQKLGPRIKIASPGVRGIMQRLPATLITIPVIVLVLAAGGASNSSIVSAIYMFIAGLSDNVFKPLLLGHGVEAPMPTILIDALGGMVAGGGISLFIGPIVLVLGYQLFRYWVDDSPLRVKAEATAAIPNADISEG